MKKEPIQVSITIKQCDLTSPVAHDLIRALNTELSRQYPEEGATHFRLDADEVSGGRGAFVVAWRGDRAIGCGAVRRIDAGVGELKRMYVIPEERNSGVGRKLLAALEAEARGLGLARLVLETGTRQIPAIALYRRAGFTDIAPFGEYIGSPLSVCMAKDL
jgi:GNAT superfamily N-acetyltransferase